MHQAEAGVVPEDRLIRGDAEERGEQGSQLRQPLEQAVVAGVGAVGGQVAVTSGEREQRVRQIELGGRGLAARQVQLQSAGCK